jgi:hypothetical protein
LKLCSAFPLLQTHPSQPIGKKHNLLRSQKNLCTSNRKRVKGNAQDATKLTRKPTCKLRHCEFFHLTGSRSLMPVIVPMYLQKCQHKGIWTCHFVKTAKFGL